MRDDGVWLGADIARCEPSAVCPMRVHCARALAPVPAHGGVMMDGTLDPYWTPVACPSYLAVTRYRRAPETKAVKRHWDDR